MKWNCYINTKRDGEWVTLARVLDIPKTRSMSDGAYANWYASKKYGFPVGNILCIPTPASERTKRTRHPRTR